MAYGPGVNEINYTDLPPTGDTIASAAQKTQNQFDALYTGLNADIVRASAAEVLAGTDTEKIITPATLTAKILGTVSEASGVPTGAVIESGSNANGGYVKFADGTMICNGVIYNSSPTTELYVTYLYLSNKTVTFPAVFAAVPSLAVAGGGDSGNVGFSGSHSETTSGTTISYWSATVSPTVTQASYLAIGRWF